MTNWRKVFSLPALGAVDPTKIHRVLGVKDSTVAAWYAGYTSAGDLVDIMGGGATKLLADGGGPTITASALQGESGNRLQAFAYVAASTQNHSKSHESWMNMFTGSFTLTMVLAPSSSGSGSDDIVAHLNGNDGFCAYISASHYVSIKLYNGTDATTVDNQLVNVRDGRYHVIHIVRNATTNLAKVVVDGISGQWTTVRAADGSNSAGTWIFYGEGGGWYDGTGLYLRVNNAALTDAQIAKEVSLWQGAGVGATWNPSMDFARAGTAYQTYSDGTMALRSAGMPRVGDGVLVEGAATQLAQFTEDFTNAYWSDFGPVTASISANATTAPNGTLTADMFIEGTAGSGNVNHYVSGPGTVIASATYTTSVFLKYKAGGRSWVCVRERGAWGENAFFNIQTGQIGTVGANLTARIVPYADGWYRCIVTCTNTAPYYYIVAGAEADNDFQYTGDGRDCFYLWGFQAEAGSFATSYVPRLDSTATSRVADDLSIPTYRLRNTLRDIVNSVPSLYMVFDQNPSGSTIADSGAAYSLTKNGQPKRYNSPIYGDTHLFDGAADYYSLANGSGGSALNGGSSFSVTAVIIPNTVTGSHIIASKGNFAAGSCGWTLYQDGAGIYLSISGDGTARVEFQKSSCLVINKPSLITATYSAGTGNIYVDDLATATNSGLAASVYANTDSFTIGAHTGATPRYFAGKMQFLSIWAGAVRTEAQHDAMYAALFQPGILPNKMGTGYHYTKLAIECEIKCLYSSTTDSGGERRWVDINGTQGNNSSSRNRLFFTQSSGKFGMNIRDDGSTEQQKLETAARTDFNRWHKVRAHYDLANFANSTLTIDDGTPIASGYSAGTFMDFTRAHINVGGLAGADAMAKIRGIDIFIGND